MKLRVDIIPSFARNFIFWFAKRSHLGYSLLMSDLLNGAGRLEYNISVLVQCCLNLTLHHCHFQDGNDLHSQSIDPEKAE